MENIALCSGEAVIACQDTVVTYEGSAITSQQVYPLSSLVFMFLGFSFLGWLWEVGLYLFPDGNWVNCGVLHGPWLPIYGVGGVLMLVLFNRFSDRPVLCFGMGVGLCGIIEYATAWLLETFLHAKWWDYSDKALNLHGRVYLSGLLLFGAAGCVILYVLAPRIHQKFMTLSQRSRRILCAVFGALFIADLIFSMLVPNTEAAISLPF